MRPIAALDAPMDLRIAMSRRFSFTTMVSDARMLNAATTTMSASTMPYTTFSSLSAEKRLRFTSIQSRARYGNPPSARSTRARRLARAVDVVDPHLDRADRVVLVEEALRVGSAM